MRTAEEVQQDYMKAAAIAGDLGYRITTNKEELRKAERRMRQLNIEMSGIANAKANEEKAKEVTDGGIETQV